MNPELESDLEPVAAYPAPRTVPLSYPGRRPAFSFLMAGAQLARMELTAAQPSAFEAIANASVRIKSGMPRSTLGAALEQLRVAPLAERIAVIGYGSNPVPGQLASKFGADAVVPVVRARMAHADLVYNLISNHGYAFAELTMGADLGACTIFITFLDRHQLQMMIATEQNYRLATVPTPLVLDSGQAIGAEIGADSARAIFMFAGFRPIWVPRGACAPIAVAELPAPGRRQPAMTQTALLALAIQEFDLRPRGIATPAQLVQHLRAQADMAEGPGKLVYELQSRIQADPRSWPPLSQSVPLVHDVCAIPGFGAPK